MRFAALAVIGSGFALAGLVLGPPAASAQAAEGTADDTEARMHFQLGRTYHDQGHFSEAAREFETAYRLSNRPQLLYNVFVAHRDAGEIESAAQALGQYLELVPDAPERDQLTARLESMNRLLGQQRATAEAAAAQRAAAERVAADAETHRAAAEAATARGGRGGDSAREGGASMVANGAGSGSESRRDTGGGRNSLLPWIVGGAGGALLAGSVALDVMALGVQTDLEDQCPNHQCPGTVDLEGLQSKGRIYAVAADSMLVLGLAGVGVGAWMLFFGGDDEAPAASAACTRGGCAVQVRLRF